MSENNKIVSADFVNRTYGQDIQVSSTPQFDKSITLYNQDLNNKGTISDKDVISPKKELNSAETESLNNMEQAYTKTEIDSKLENVNQRIEHNQEKIELILSNGLEGIKSEIKSELEVFKTGVNKEVSNLKSVIGSMIVPFALMIAPIVMELVSSMKE